MSPSHYAAARAATELDTPLPTQSQGRYIAYLHQGINKVDLVVVDRDKPFAERYLLRLTPDPNVTNLADINTERTFELLRAHGWTPAGAWRDEPYFGEATMYSCPVIPRPSTGSQEPGPCDATDPLR